MKNSVIHKKQKAKQQPKPINQQFNLSEDESNDNIAELQTIDCSEMNSEQYLHQFKSISLLENQNTQMEELLSVLQKIKYSHELQLDQLTQKYDIQIQQQKEQYNQLQQQLQQFKDNNDFEAFAKLEKEVTHYKQLYVQQCQRTKKFQSLQIYYQKKNANKCVENGQLKKRCTKLKKQLIQKQTIINQDKEQCNKKYSTLQKEHQELQNRNDEIQQIFQTQMKKFKTMQQKNLQLQINNDQYKQQIMLLNQQTIQDKQRLEQCNNELTNNYHIINQNEQQLSILKTTEQINQKLKQQLQEISEEYRKSEELAKQQAEQLIIQQNTNDELLQLSSVNFDQTMIVKHIQEQNSFEQKIEQLQQDVQLIKQQLECEQLNSQTQLLNIRRLENQLASEQEKNQQYVLQQDNQNKIIQEKQQQLADEYGFALQQEQNKYIILQQKIQGNEQIFKNFQIQLNTFTQLIQTEKLNSANLKKVECQFNRKQIKILNEQFSNKQSIQEFLINMQNILQKYGYECLSPIKLEVRKVKQNENNSLKKGTILQKPNKIFSDISDCDIKILENTCINVIQNESVDQKVKNQLNDIMKKKNIIQNAD